MTIKDLQKLIADQQPEHEEPQAMRDLKRKLYHRPFYIWGKEHNKILNSRMACCFNHAIPAGLPKKDGMSMPLFDYERMIYSALFIPGYLNSSPGVTKMGHTMEDHREKEKRMKDNFMFSFKLKHCWIKKSTGLGVSELFLRIMCWLALKNDDLCGSQMCIVVGPNWDLAVKMIKRMKAFFAPNIYFDSKESVLELNGCSIQAYPSNNLSSFRSLTNPKFILIKEGDYFPKFEQEEVRQTSERYIGKSDPWIAMVSTPNRPDGLFSQIEKESFDTCIYKKLFLDYTYGVGKIYTDLEIEKARASPSFPREYMLEYQGHIGNVYSHKSIENATKVEYDPDRIILEAKKSIGLDPAWGSSNFAIVVTQYVNGKIQVIFADEYPRPFFQAMIDKVWELRKKLGTITNIYVDASSPEIIQSLKRDFNEPYDNQYVKEKIAWCKKNKLLVENYMTIVPISFSVDGANFLSHSKALLESPDNLIAIHPRYDKLITSLSSAVATEMKLDKSSTIYDDILDSFRMALSFYRMGD